MAKVKCKWCGNMFEQDIVFIGASGKPRRSQVKCNKCFRNLPSSIKEPADSMNRRHIHMEIK